MSDIGYHLLGRIFVPDENDWPMAEALEHLVPAPDDSLLDKTVREVIAEGTFFSSWKGILAFWRWVKSIVHPQPAPTPPPAPSGSKTWEDLIQLDQGNTGHCVGFGWAGWGDSAPIEDTYQNPDAHAIYYEAKVIDGQPRQENGSSVRSGAKAMQNRGRLSSYVFAANTDEIKQWICMKGPVVVGTDWTEDMFSPDANGYVRPTGTLAGGHCYVMLGYLADEDAFLFQNSWGTGWALNGRFKIKVADFEKLLAANGEACAGLEV